MPVPEVQKIGKYEILAELGQGGFGRVYRAFDPTVGRPVAIKILTTEGNRDLLTRFRNEATAAGNLRHRNIVTVYDYGEFNGRPFLVMELLEGEDLTQVIGSGTPLSLLQKMDIMDQIAAGLDCAHRNGVLHRDVKPANIRILPDGTVKIMDFGIARVNSERNATRLTQQGDLIGTILYMSPEQFGGAEADALCDIFAYGVIYFELLTGKHPFRSSDPRAVMFKITMEEAEPIRSLAPECPEGLERILNRALHKERELRYQNLRDLQLDAEPLMLDLRQGKARELVASAQALSGSHDNQQALALINEALNLDPANRDARAMRESVQRQLQREALQPRIRAMLQTAEEQVARRAFTQSVQTLESALKLDPADEGVSAALASAREQMKRAKDAARLASAALVDAGRGEWLAASGKSQEAARIDPLNVDLARIRDAIGKHVCNALADVDSQIEQGQLEPAIRGLKDLEALEPASLEIQSRLASARELQARRERIGTAIRKAEQAIERSRFDEALEVLSGAGMADDPDILALRVNARAKIAARDRDELMERTARDCGRLRQENRYDEALELVGVGLSKYADEPALVDLKSQLQRESALAAAREKLDRGASVEALEELRRAVEQYPEDRELRRLLTEAQRSEAVKSTAAMAQGCLERQDFGEAIRVLESALGDWPHAGELEDLLRAARDSQALRALEQECDELAGAKRFVEARRVAEGGLSRFADAAGLVERRDRVRQQAVQSAVAKARGLVVRQEFDGAVEVLESARRDWPQEPELEDLLRSTRDSQALRAVEQQCDELAGANHFVEARKAVEGGLNRFPNAPGLVERRDRVRRQAVQSTASEARRRMERREFGGAIQVLESALRDWPNESELEELLRSTRDSQEASERERELRAVGQRCDELAGAKHFVEALKVLEEGLGRFPDAPGLGDRRQRLRQQIALGKGAQLLEQGDAAQAVDVLTRACETVPNDPELLRLLGEAQNMLRTLERRNAVQKALTDAQRRTGQQDFSNAISTLETALQEWPDENELQNCLRDVRKAQSDWAELQAITRVAQQSRDLAGRHRYADALKVIETGLSGHPDQPLLLELRREFEEQWAGEQRAEGIERALEQGRALLREGRADEAVGVLERASSQYPDGADWQPLLREANEALAAQRKREAVKNAAAAAAQKSDREDFAGAIATLENALQSWPDEDALVDGLRKAREAQAGFERRSVIDKLTRQVDNLAAKNRLADALELVKGGLPELLELQRQLQDKLTRQQRSAAVSQILKDGRKLLEQGQAVRAVELLGSACSQYPEETKLTQLLADAQTALRLLERREGVERAATEAQRSIEKKDFAAAIQTLESATQAWPGEKRLDDLLKSARQEHEKKQRQDAIRAAVQQAETLTHPGKALKLVQSALREHGSDPSLLQLQARLQDAIAQQPASRSRIPLVAGIAALVVMAAVALPRIFRGDRNIELAIDSNIKGASINVGGQTCVTPECALKLPPGDYKLVAVRDGFGAVEQSLSLRAGNGNVKVPLTFTPLPQRVQVNTNFAAGQVLVDGISAGDLRDGQFSLDGVASGRHTIRVTGSDADFEAEWRGEPGASPELIRPITAKNVQATLLANAGENGTLACNCDTGSVKVDGGVVASPRGAGGTSFAVTNLKEGARRITAADRSLVFDVRPNPTLNIVLSLDRNVGTLVIETGQDNARVYLNGQPYRRLTEHGLLRLPVDVGEYSIRVEKAGFRAPPETRAEIRKGEEKQIKLSLTQLPASLEIAGALPGSAVKLDGKPVGETTASGTLQMEVTPGEHQIELSKDDYSPVRFGAQFTPGQTTRPRREQVTMARVIPPPARVETKQLDPRQIEEQDWEKVRNSNSLEELEDFMRRHPGGTHTDGARLRISQLRQQLQADAARQAEQTAWEALDKSKRAAVQDYLARFGNGAHQQEARALIVELEKREAEALAAARAATELKANEQEQAGRGQADQQAIGRALGQYEAAYNAKDLKALQGIWRGMTKVASDRLADQFRYARVMTFKITPTATPVVNGDSATVVCTRSLDLTTRDGQRVNNGNERVRVTLDRAGAGWVIRSIDTY